MLALQEFFRSIFGAWRLAHLDANGMYYFNLSFEGFFRSFLAPILAAPFFLILVLLRIGPHTDVNALIEIEGITYFATWLGFPVLMVPLCRLLDLGQHYVAFIVAYNWSQIVLVAFFLPLYTVVAYDLLGEPLGAILGLLGLTLGYTYFWFIARTALQTTALIAFGLTIIDVLLDLVTPRIVELLV